MVNEHAVKEFNHLLSTQLEIEGLATKALNFISELPEKYYSNLQKCVRELINSLQS
jgi:hypothetical protein